MIKELNILRKKKYICLKGLLNWEEILLADKKENNDNLINETKEKNNSIDKYNELKEIIKKQIFYMDMYARLNKWVLL